MINLELQSANDPLLPLRMAEYASRVYRIYQRFPRQYVLYVGEPELRMNSELAANDFLCRFTINDMDRRETIRRILSRIAKPRRLLPLR